MINDWNDQFMIRNLWLVFWLSTAWYAFAHQLDMLLKSVMWPQMQETDVFLPTTSVWDGVSISNTNPDRELWRFCSRSSIPPTEVSWIPLNGLKLNCPNHVDVDLMSGFKFICQSRRLKTLNPPVWRTLPAHIWEQLHQKLMVNGFCGGSLVWA